MAGQQAFLMRAFRSADGSFHTWRAGEFDSDMSEATGPQAPPFPVIDYSDFTVVSFLGGPLARSDETSFLLTDLGTPGSPVTFGPGPATVEGGGGTDCQDFRSISIWVVVTTPGTAATISVASGWSNIPAPAVGTDIGIQRSDDAIVDGDSPQNVYSADFDVAAGPPGTAFGPYNVPVRGRKHLALVSTDTGDLEGYVLAMRFA